MSSSVAFSSEESGMKFYISSEDVSLLPPTQPLTVSATTTTCTTTDAPSTAVDSSNSSSPPPHPPQRLRYQQQLSVEEETGGERPSLQQHQSELLYAALSEKEAVIVALTQQLQECEAELEAVLPLLSQQQQQQQGSGHRETREYRALHSTATEEESSTGGDSGGEQAVGTTTQVGGGLAALSPYGAVNNTTVTHTSSSLLTSSGVDEHHLQLQQQAIAEQAAASQQRHLTRLELRVRQAEEQLASREELITSLQGELNEAVIRWDALRAELRQAEALAGSHRVQARKLAEEKAALQKRYESFRSRHKEDWSSLQEEISHLSAGVETAEVSRQTQRQEVLVAKAESAALREQLADLQAAQAHSRADWAAERAAFAEALARRDDEVHQLHQQLLQQTDQRAVFMQEAAAARHERDAVQAQLSDILAAQLAEREESSLAHQSVLSQLHHHVHTTEEMDKAVQAAEALRRRAEKRLAQSELKAERLMKDAQDKALQSATAAVEEQQWLNELLNKHAESQVQTAQQLETALRERDEWKQEVEHLILMRHQAEKMAKEELSARDEAKQDAARLHVEVVELQAQVTSLTARVVRMDRDEKRLIPMLRQRQMQLWEWVREGKKKVSKLGGEQGQRRAGSGITHSKPAAAAAGGSVGSPVVEAVELVETEEDGDDEVMKDTSYPPSPPVMRKKGEKAVVLQRKHALAASSSTGRLQQKQHCHGALAIAESIGLLVDGVEELIASLHTTALQQQAVIVHLRHQRQQERLRAAARERSEEQRREEAVAEEVMRVLSVLPLMVSETLRHAAEDLAAQQDEHAAQSSPPPQRQKRHRTREEAPQQQQSAYEDLVRGHLDAAILSDEVRAECETLVSLLLGGGSTAGWAAAAPPTESRAALVEEDEAEAIAAAAATVSKETTMASVTQLLRRYASFTATFIWEAEQLNALRVCLKDGAASSSLPQFLVAEGGKKEKKTARSLSRPEYSGGAAAGQAARLVLACGVYLSETASRSVRR